MSEFVLSYPPGILNDSDIMFLCENAKMIDPYIEKLSEEPGELSYGPSSFGYDVRAGYSWHVFRRKSEDQIIDPKAIGDHYDIIECGPRDTVIIPANSYALTHTLETIDLPRNITGLCIGKSTYARAGIHVNITPLEAGWRGQVTVEISNGTPLPVKVYPGEAIMQVLFFSGRNPHRTYADRKGKYQDQQGVVHGKVR